MNPLDKKIKTRIRMHPEMLRNILIEPKEDTLDTIQRYNLFESKGAFLTQILLSVLPHWEFAACEGNIHLAKILRLLEKSPISPSPQEEEFLRANFLRIRLLAETPGFFPFSPMTIQENLLEFLQGAEVLADLPQVKVVNFTKEELTPIASELTRYRLNPLSRRYVQNLFHPQRQEAILSVLAHISKNYPLLGTCRQAYALLLSLDKIENWSRHPFCLRLIANRFWEFRTQEIL